MMIYSNKVAVRLNKTGKTGLLAVFASIALVAAAPAGADDDEWQFKLTPYVWAPAIDGNVGIADVGADVNMPFSDVFSNLEMAGMLSFEARRNRWGFIIDGVYMRLSSEEETPGPFFNTIEPTIEMAAIDIGLFYRVLEGKRGWLDLLAGARYVNVEGELDMNPDYAAVDDIASDVMDKTTAAISSKLEDAVEKRVDELATEVAALKSGEGDMTRDQLRAKIQEGLAGNIDGIIGRIDNNLPAGAKTDLSLGDGTVGDAIRNEIRGSIQAKLDALGEAMRDAVADKAKQSIDAKAAEIRGNAAAIKTEIRNAAKQAIDELKRNASEEVKKALDSAEKKLAEAIEDGMDKAAAADVSGSKQWIDPYVGMRGRLNLTDNIFAGAKADIGGFGVGSDLTWQLFAGVGVSVTENVELETGWRHLAIDYSDDTFLMDVAFSGIVFNVGVSW